jgi:hypothetical protein
MKAMKVPVNKLYDECIENIIIQGDKNWTGLDFRNSTDL